ncbi:hypothetical protein ACIOZM_14475 [Pseudomonas sp. NPDC087346]|uniref:hypothetical protein n=1 Tax=Pseudomonas sp. NPDC087346 TaxID=3364438 RepID=UPI0038125B3B
MRSDVCKSGMQQQFQALAESGGSLVMGSSVMTFFDGLSRQDKQFVKDSIGLAEYQADLLYDRKRDPGNWFEYYTGALWSVGWSLEHDAKVIVDRDFSGDVLDTWATALSLEVSRATVKKVTETFQLLEGSAEGVELLTGSARKWGDFRFLPVQYNMHKELEIVLSNVRLLSLEWNSSYLFWKVRYSQSQLDMHARRFVITPRQMDMHRSKLSAAVIELRQKEIELA